ncbi:hypothetical protein BDP27DRAFT_1424319 [Rhodocollybia butyracea]|uniref:Uncharacterized protein n=1 Tax=Rhodocollybia butyracea TaxID=206335 RepID=A0A9P5PQ40_9AGAR|nr:hypothetical protein BDP27DRAFT_1424319 [Rhodocollybia butyracea]
MQSVPSSHSSATQSTTPLSPVPPSHLLGHKHELASASASTFRFLSSSPPIPFSKPHHTISMMSQQMSASVVCSLPLCQRPWSSLPTSQPNTWNGASPFMQGPVHVIQAEDLVSIPPQPQPTASPTTSCQLAMIDQLLETYDFSDDEVDWKALEQGYLRKPQDIDSDSDVEFVKGPALKKHKRSSAASMSSLSSSSLPTHCLYFPYASSSSSLTTLASCDTPDEHDDEDIQFIGFGHT